MKNKALLSLWIVLGLSSNSFGMSPLEAACSIGDKLITDTPFQNRLVVAKKSKQFNNVETVDFARTFGHVPGLTAFALTSFQSDDNMTLPVEFDFSGNCEIFLNNQLIFSGDNNGAVNINHDERNIELRHKLILPLKRGENILLSKVRGTSHDWLFCIQPEPDKMQVGGVQPLRVNIGLENLKGIDNSISAISNWLVCGPFDEPQNEISKMLCTDVSEGRWGRMLPGVKGKNITWTLPHLEVVADVIDPAEWGTPYNWNYHNGGTAWAMQRLSEATGDTRYDNYADNFCNFHLDNLPLIQHQVDELRIFDCTNHHIYKTPLLDFTLAPSLPYVYKLCRDDISESNPLWHEWVKEMINYSGEQLRMPGKAAYTRTSPEKFTTWVDDMFMGIPFLVHASRYSGNPDFLDDAIEQIDDYNKIVWDKDANLYMHAQYSERNCKLPHWSRANGWGLWAITEVLTYLPENDHRFKKLLNHYRKHIESLIKYQTPDGLWYNVLEYPESRPEVSGSAIFTMAIARGISRGWLDSKKYLPVIERAWKGLESRIDPDGSVRDICYGTMCSEDVNYYINRPFYTNDTHGLFAVLFACIELKDLIKN